MTAPISAKAGALSIDTAVVSDVRNIRFEQRSDNKEYRSSSTAGFTKRIAGHKDYSLSFDVYAADGAIVFSKDEGDNIAVIATAVAGKTLTGNFIIDRISGIVDIEGGDLVGLSVECSGQGSPGVA